MPTTCWYNRFALGIVLILFCGAAKAVDAERKQRCLVCDKPPMGKAHIFYRGLRYPVCQSSCDLLWERAEQEGMLDPFVSKVEPRGALFQGDSKFLNPIAQEVNPTPISWMMIGVWALVAILSGSLAAALAVARHRRPIGPFFVALLFPVVGMVAVWLWPRVGGEFELRGNKIPRTHDEIYCQQCLRALHPSASTCPGCGAKLDPCVTSEVQKVVSSS